LQVAYHAQLQLNGSLPQCIAEIHADENDEMTDDHLRWLLNNGPTSGSGIWDERSLTPSPALGFSPPQLTMAPLAPPAEPTRNTQRYNRGDPEIAHDVSAVRANAEMIEQAYRAKRLGAANDPNVSDARYVEEQPMRDALIATSEKEWQSEASKSRDKKRQRKIRQDPTLPPATVRYDRATADAAHAVTEGDARRIRDLSQLLHPTDSQAAASSVAEFNCRRAVTRVGAHRKGEQPSPAESQVPTPDADVDRSAVSAEASDGSEVPAHIQNERRRLSKKTDGWIVQ
jgi:hypothetical protein